MSQLEYQSAFPPGSFFHNQALAQAPYPGQQQHQQQQQQGQQIYHGAQQQAQGLPQHQGQQFLNQSGHQQLQQQQQQRSIGPDGMYNASSAQPAGPFTAAQYPPAGSVSAAQQQAALRHSASPHQPQSPFTAGTPQPQQIKYPMAAPPLPHTPVNTQQFASLTTSTPSAPQSPKTQASEQNRIKLILEINAELLQEVSSLQAQGQGGATNAQNQAQMKSLNMDDKMASDEYIQTMRRVQANLAWLAPRGNVAGSTQKQLLGPAHMTPPPHMPQLQAKYARLKELCPGWAGYDQMPARTSGANLNGSSDRNSA